jgi:hypothetical protein
MQQRKNEILAKRAKLAELKKQRELRQKEFTNNRNSVGDASEVWRYDRGSSHRETNWIILDRFAGSKSFWQ